MDWILGKKLWARFSHWAEELIGISAQTLGNVLNTVLVIVLYLVLTRLVRRWVVQRIPDPQRRFTLNKSVSYGFGVLATIAVAKIWLLGKVNLATYLGILSAGIAIALKDPIVNLAAWLFILWRQPFKAGDRVEIGSIAGDVVDIGMFMTSMVEIGKWVTADQSTGRIIHVPNGRIFVEPVANYTQGFQQLWNEIGVTVTFESDWRKAHQLLTDLINEIAIPTEEMKQHARRLAEHHNVSYGYLTPIVWVEVVDIGVKLTIRYLCDARKRRSTADQVWRAVLETFEQNGDIDFAYPTQRFYANHLEGKPGAGGPPRPVNAPSEAQIDAQVAAAKKARAPAAAAEEAAPPEGPAPQAPR